ncbi:MAG: hypothetical protein L0I29_05705 [Hyphomicrobiales bacterium]|nr:hypothetical protein [Hyphomicrobiales bacterium]
MASRTERLKKLGEVQEQLKAFHEMRRATALAEAAAAGREAAELAARFDALDSLTDLFPDLYARAVERALRRQDQKLASAHVEAGHVATQTARTNMVERSWREATRADERQAEDRATLEAVERTLITRK